MSISNLSRRTRSLAWFLIGCAIFALALAVVYVLLTGAQTTQAIRETQVDNHALLDRVARLSAEIDDCTEVTGKCHRRGLRQTAAAVSSINRQSVATAACTVILSRQSTTWTAAELAAQIDKCAAETVARLDSKR